MQTFTISQLSQFSGIKPHTIRIWEQRYNALSPMRTQGNTRFYDDNQLRRLLNLVSLQRDGQKISDLCLLDDKSLFELIQEKLQNHSSKIDKFEFYISQLITAGIDYKEHRFNQLFTEGLKLYGLIEFYNKVLCPLLTRLGLLWSCDNVIPPQEHFICNLLKQKLYSFLDKLPFSEKETHDWLLLSPENEFHEMGLLMAHIILKKAGKKVLYLGANVPLKSFIDTVTETGAKNVLLFVLHSGQKNIINDYANLFYTETKNKQFYLAGNLENTISSKTNKEIKLLNNLTDLENLISKNKN